MTTAIQDRLSRRTKFLYGISDFGFACTDTTMQVLFAIFMTDVVGVKPAYAALAIFIGRTWDYFNDPLVGSISPTGCAAAGVAGVPSCSSASSLSD
jgi:Na+/melibiose symporter-like transporter